MSARQLDTHDTAILSALTALGDGWHDRAAIAAQLGRSALNPEDLLSLDVMARDGAIEQSKVMAPGKGGSGQGSGHRRHIAYRIAQNGGHNG